MVVLCQDCPDRSRNCPLLLSMDMPQASLVAVSTGPALDSLLYVDGDLSFELN